ncbi:MAG: hypothetical protein R3F65_06945 [bacterium]
MRSLLPLSLLLLTAPVAHAARCNDDAPSVFQGVRLARDTLLEVDGMLLAQAARIPEDQFYLSGDIWGLFGFLGAGLDIVPWEAELRSGWLGVGRRWLWSAGYDVIDES